MNELLVVLVYSLVWIDSMDVYLDHWLSLIYLLNVLNLLLNYQLWQEDFHHYDQIVFLQLMNQLNSISMEHCSMMDVKLSIVDKFYEVFLSIEFELPLHLERRDQWEKKMIIELPSLFKCLKGLFPSSSIDEGFIESSRWNFRLRDIFKGI